ncbi:hypothetical protein KFK09_028273 [Dendrobium nobile]|uniref:Uncharacterized protein n=1 Tax=Dendrobium nobile TaxID=94219 RepID=A0A8T3A2W7_DENNO|nr:hypothetical protein KFK09_028273 [Dendrobium nobile]
MGRPAWLEVSGSLRAEEDGSRGLRLVLDREGEGSLPTGAREFGPSGCEWRGDRRRGPNE